MTTAVMAYSRTVACSRCEREAMPLSHIPLLLYTILLTYNSRISIVPRPIVIPAQAGIHNTLSVSFSSVRGDKHSRFVDPRASAPLRPGMTGEGAHSRMEEGCLMFNNVFSQNCGVKKI